MFMMIIPSYIHKCISYDYVFLLLGISFYIHNTNRVGMSFVCKKCHISSFFEINLNPTLNSYATSFSL